MFQVELPSWLSFVVALVASQLLGFLWYGKALFGKAWMEATGKSQEEVEAQSKPSVYVTAVVSATVMILVLSNVMSWARAESIPAALAVAIFAWLGFVATASVLNTAFEGRSWRSWAIDNLYHLVNMILAAIILVLL